MPKSRLHFAFLKNPQLKLLFSWLSLFLLPALGVFLLQVLSGFQQKIDNSIFPSSDWITPLGNRFIWNYLILFLFFGFLFFLPKFKISSIILSTMLFLFSLAQHFVILFRNTIIFPWDFQNLAIAFNVSKSYNFNMDKEIFIALGLYSVMIFLILFSRPIRFPKKIIIGAPILVAIFFVIYHQLFLTHKQNQLRAGVTFYYTTVNYSYSNGVLLNFFYNTKFLIHPAPDDYSSKEIKSLVESYTTPSSWSEEKSLVPNGEKPDILLIMSEAFADLRNISEIDSNQDFMPFWDSLEGNNVIKKKLLVSEFGGNTANSEFEILTGMSLSFFELGTYPFKQYIRHPLPSSFPAQLKSQGYQTLATHPFDPKGWDRHKVFPLLGFEQFYTRDSFINPLIYRNFISDKSSFEFIINQYKEHKQVSSDSPLFQYLLTMQNHGGFTSKAKLPEQITLNSSKTYPQANQYLSLMKLSDQALEGLLSYFEQQEDPIVIILYGDHLPGLTDNYIKDTIAQSSLPANDKKLLKFTTNVLVWANFDISQSKLAQHEDELISANYLMSYVSDIINLPPTPLQNFLQASASEITALTSRYVKIKNGKIYSHNDPQIPESVQSLLNTYEKMQYYYFTEDK